MRSRHVTLPVLAAVAAFVIQCALGFSPARAATGSVVNATAASTFVDGSAGYSATYDQCSTPCTWRAVADAQDVMYQCDGDPYTLATAQIAWTSSDRHVGGTIATPPVGFTGPGRPVRLCLYLAVDDPLTGATTYTELAEASFTPNSLPGPAETFSALIAPAAAPVAKAVRVKHHPRHRHHRRARRHA